MAIYPTARKVADLLKRETFGGGCLLGHHVTTFPQIVDGLWRELADSRSIVGPVGERLALEEVVARLCSNGADLPRSQGFRSHLASLIRQLKSSAARPADLMEACETLPPGLGTRMRLFAEVFAAYEDELAKRDVADAYDRERAVVEMLHSMEAAKRRPHLLIGVEKLLVAEIYDFSILQFMIVAALIRIVGDAELTIQAQAHQVGAVNRFAELTWNRFVGEESIADKVLPDFVRRDGRMGRLGFVLEHLFTDSYPEPPPEDGSVEIIEAPNALREAEEVARAIRRRMEKSGEDVSLDRIAIVARDLQSYTYYLEDIFRRYRIPLNIARGRPLRGLPPARAVIGMLKVAAEDLSREAMTALCNGPCLQVVAGRYAGLPIECGYLDRSTRPLDKCIEARRRELADAAARATPDRKDRLTRRLESFDRGASAWRELVEVLESLEPPATVARHVERTIKSLRRLGFEPAREELAESAAAMGAVIGALGELAREASLVAPDRIVSLAEFTDLVETAFMETIIGRTDAAEPGGVRALPVLEARGLDFDLVFILGLNDGVFPVYRSENSLVPDDLIRTINPLLRKSMRRRMGANAPDAPGPILRTRYERNAEEPFLFFLAMSIPARAVVLSYCAADDRGNPLPPSPFVTEVIRLLAADEDHADVVKRIAAEEFIASIDDCFAAGEFLNRAAHDGILHEPLIGAFVEPAKAASIMRRTGIERRREAYLALTTREAALAERRAVRKARKNSAETGVPLELSPDPEKFASATIFDGRVGPSDRLTRFVLKAPDGSVRRWSASQLSELAACGFAYFAGRILMLRDEDEPDYEQSALETGSLIHEILHDLFGRAEVSDPDMFRRAASEILGQWGGLKRIEARDPAFFELEWKSLEAMVREVVEYELARRASGGVPDEMRHEHAITFTLRADSAVVDEIVLEGRIDRLEIHRGGDRIKRIKVVDYKSSRNLARYRELLRLDTFASHDFQMPVYALGVAEMFRAELAPDAAVEASYIALRNRIKEAEPREIPLAMLETDPARCAAIDAAGGATIAGRIVRLVVAALEGRFDIDPLSCSPYCPHRRVCRYNKSFSQP